MTKLRNIFFFKILNTYVSLIFHAKVQPKIFSGSREEVDSVIFAIFCNRSRLGYSTLFDFTILKLWSLIMLHVKFNNNWCNDSEKRLFEVV